MLETLAVFVGTTIGIFGSTPLYIYIHNWIIGICYLLVVTYIWWITFSIYLLLLILFFWKSKNLFAADSGFWKSFLLGRVLTYWLTEEQRFLEL